MDDASGCWLLTGYGPFRGLEHTKELTYDVNPSQSLVEALDGEIIAGKKVVGRILPDESLAVGAALKEHLSTLSPAAVICIGVWPGRSGLQVERIAVNVMDYQFPDDDGFRPVDEPIDRNGPAAYFASLPIKAIVQHIRTAGVPAYISNSASTHGCNLAMYQALHWISQLRLDVRAGFIHVPDLPSKIAADRLISPSMDLSMMVAGLHAALEAVAANPTDIKIPVTEYEW